MAGCLLAGTAQAQVLLCPEAPPTGSSAADVSANAERLLKRLTIALDLHGHRGIGEEAILQSHAETPSALLAKLTNVVDRCTAASVDLEGFYEALPDLRRAFLKAVDVAVNEGITEDSQAIRKANLGSSKADRLEESIDLSVRGLWRKLWFRSADAVGDPGDRWAVIVASPQDADSGWDQLGTHQRRWIDTYFQLHVPYYESNPHHAIVVGRRLPQEQAARLRDYVIELGMADDAFLWPLPEEDGSVDDGKVVFEVETLDEGQRKEGRLDLSGLN